MSLDEQAVARGRQAAREWPELESAFSQVRQAILMELVQTPVGQDVKILKLHLSVQNLTAIEKALRLVIDNGSLAAHALAQAGVNRPN